MINFSPIEQRYVASCYPLPDRPGIASCLDWRKTFTHYARNLQEVAVAIAQLAEPFPHLARLALEGVFNRQSIQSYFEGLEFPEKGEGLKAHNPNLYLFAISTMRAKLPEEILRSVLAHVDGCSVKPACLSRKSVMGYDGEKTDQPIDVAFLSHDPPISDCVLVHGCSQNGHQAIRYITPAEYQRFQAWFHARQQSKLNPFLQH